MSHSRLSRLVLGLGVVSLGAGLVALGYVLLSPDAPSPISSRPTALGDSTFAGFDQEISLSVPDGSTEPGETKPSSAPLARIRAPSVAIDAPVEVLGLDASGVMENPSGPEVVAWYRFSGRPGFGGNAVFAGHLDFAGYGPAVFWRLRELGPEDQVLIELEDGTRYVYTVLEARTYDVATAPVEEIVGPTALDMVTLITCAGKFDQRTKQYDQRLVVRAVRS